MYSEGDEEIASRLRDAAFLGVGVEVKPLLSHPCTRLVYVQVPVTGKAARDTERKHATSLGVLQKKLNNGAFK